MTTPHDHRQISEYLDGAMRPAGREAFERRLETEADLVGELERAREARGALRSLPREHVSSGFASRVVEAGRAQQRRRKVLTRRKAALAVAAAVLLTAGLWQLSRTWNRSADDARRPPLAERDRFGEGKTFRWSRRKQEIIRKYGQIVRDIEAARKAARTELTVLTPNLESTRLALENFLRKTGGRPLRNGADAERSFRYLYETNPEGERGLSYVVLADAETRSDLVARLERTALLSVEDQEVRRRDRRTPPSAPQVHKVVEPLVITLRLRGPTTSDSDR